MRTNWLSSNGRCSPELEDLVRSNKIFQRDDCYMHKYQSRTTLATLYLLSQQGIFFLLLVPLLGYCCYFFYAIGEVPFGGRTGHINFHKDSDPILFWLVWLVFFACFLSFCALFVDQFYKRTRRVTELRKKPYA